MFIKYDEVEFFEFFESQPVAIGEYEAGNFLYSYKKNEFEIILFMSIYEKCIKGSITYKEKLVYSQRYNNVSEIKKTDSNILNVYIDGKESVLIKKEPQIGIIVR